jgi:hypothetical protein
MPQKQRQKKNRKVSENIPQKRKIKREKSKGYSSHKEETVDKYL